MHQLINNILFINETLTYNDYPYIESIIPCLPHELIIDFSNCSYIDSAALGLLLILNENADIIIKNTQDTVNKILTIANFQDIFPIQR